MSVSKLNEWKMKTGASVEYAEVNTGDYGLHQYRVIVRQKNGPARSFTGNVTPGKQKAKGSAAGAALHVLCAEDEPAAADSSSLRAILTKTIGEIRKTNMLPELSAEQMNAAAQRVESEVHRLVVREAVNADQ